MNTRELEQISQLIARALQNPLPGSEAQYRMAPSSRRLSGLSSKARQAAVMILMFPTEDDISICFIQRTEYHGAHSGQISFPGGTYEEGDTSLEATVKRETLEETGIDAKMIRLLGKLTPLPVPVSNFLVHPFAGYLDYEPIFNPDPLEVSFMILAPMRVLLDPQTIQKEKWNLMNESVMVPFYHVNGYRIWGATAMILSEFLEIISQAGLVHHFR